MMRRKSKKRQATTTFEKTRHLFHITYDVIWSVILFFLVIAFIGLFFAGGVGAGYFASLVKDEPIRSYASMKQEIYDYEETTHLYFADNILIGEISADLHREDTTLDKISTTLTDAVIATEDENFYDHKGVVPKAIIRAIIQEATNANVKTGGSTLTQQLIKLQVLTNEVSFDRKAKEILLALRLEESFDKDEILEAYLNIIPYGRNASGRNIAGVQTAAKGIFNVNADEVNLPQAAYLAGLPQNPYIYTPFQTGGGLKDEEGLKPGLNRMKVVLKRMLDSKYISKKEYDEAIKYDIVADFTKKKDSSFEKYPYLTQKLEEEARDILVTILAEEDGYSEQDLNNNSEDSKKLRAQYKEMAQRQLKRNGYNIHSTINKKIYDEMQKTMKGVNYLGPDITFTDKATGEKKTERVQAAAVLKENHTGKIISFVGGPGFGRGENEINYINAVRPNGSTMKPLYYAVALENGIIQPGSPIPDVKTDYNGWTPRNYVETAYYGINPARDALADSFNVSSVYIYNKLLPLNITQSYIEKMGITSLREDEYTYLNFAIGRPDYGIKVQDNISAFQTFGNNGKFVEDYMIEKITDQEGNIIYEHESAPVEVFSEVTNYLAIDMMRDVINKGTATFVKSQLNNNNVDWSGKTGTSEKHNDLWFVATNPNVTFGVWMGYDTPHDLRTTCVGCSLAQNERVQKLWSDLVNTAASIDPELVTPTERFKRPEGIVERSYCAISGMLPSELCKKAGLIRSDLFNAKYVPTEIDDSLIKGSYVTVDGKSVVAGANTPSEFVKGDGLTFNPEFLKRNGYDKLNDITELYPRTNRSQWEKISAPSGKMGETLKDNGSSPAPPSSLKASGNKLSWSKSSSKDVVGYRIYYSNKPGGDLKKIGSTTSTETSFTGNSAVFYVKAVNYFGRESAASNPVTVGKTNDDEKNKDKDKDKNKDKETEKDNDQKEKSDNEQANNEKKENKPNNNDNNNHN